MVTSENKMILLKKGKKFLQVADRLEEWRKNRKEVVDSLFDVIHKKNPPATGPIRKGKKNIKPFD